MLHVSHLTKQYDGADTPAIQDLSFSFEKGQIVGLLGPNGAGKTTTISIVCGLISDFEGEINLLGHNRRTQSAELQRKISVVPQQIALYPTLSCRENLLYYGRMYQLGEAKLNNLIADYLQQFGLFEHADKQIKHYSGGMKRRANIIASLLHEPELLILDEPTAGVDVQSRSMILEFLRDFQRQGRSVIYTSHLLDEAESICKNILIIDQGKKIIQGEPALLIQQNACANLEELFIKLTGRQVRD